MPINCNCPLPAEINPNGATGLSAACGGTQFLLFMGLLETFLSRQCDIADPCRRPRIDRGPPSSEPDATYDFIVVGAGAAGIPVAARLSENPANRVLLIEAGGHEPIGLQVPLMMLPFAATPVHWRYRTEPNAGSYLAQQQSAGAPVIWQAGKVLGGGTGVNSMHYIRGTAEDYDQWARLGNRGWSYAEVMPFFWRAEDHQNIERVDRRYHATGGPVPVSMTLEPTQLQRDFLQAAADSGYATVDFNGANSTGAAIADKTVHNGVRSSTSRSYLHPISGEGKGRRRNLHIRTHTQVTRVLIDAATKRAYGVEARDSEGRLLRWLASKEVIVSAGAIQSPMLLMHSGIGPKRNLQRFDIRPVVNLPGVGQHMMSHAGVPLFWKSATRNGTTGVNWAAATEYLLSRTGPLAEVGSQIYIRRTSKLAQAKGEGVDGQLLLHDLEQLPQSVCSQTGAVSPTSEEPLMIGAWSVAVRPKSHGRIELRSADPLAPPLIYSNELDDPYDVEVILDGIGAIRRIFASPVFEPYELELQRAGGQACAHLPVLSDAYWRCAIRQDTRQFVGHQAGTCRMAPPADRRRVVDDQLRVYGVRGLRVADASIMPEVVAANPMATCTMIGEKCAQMVLDAWQ